MNATGVNLFLPRARVSMATAALGGDIEVPTIDGGRSRVKSPQAASRAARCACAARACPPCAARGTGDMIIELAVETPVNLTATPEGTAARI